jgi:DNA-binding response OmpR family regulator
MKILYVEDDLSIASVAKFLFLKTEHHLVFCQTIADAVNVMARCGQKIDLILLDMYLPDGRGVELLKRMKTLGLTTPVIITTGFYDDHAEELKPFELSGPICKVIHKPFLPETLLQTLNGLEKSLAV